MINFYSEDLDSFETVAEEWTQWRSFVTQLRLNKEEANARPSEMMVILKENNLESAFQMFM